MTNAPIKNIPKSCNIYVSTYSINPREPTSTNYLYKERVLQFEVTLVSKIKVESTYRRGIFLNKDERTKDIRVYSNVPFSS